MGDRTVLVTGGAGYIGAHACKALARAGYEVVAYDNLEYGHREFASYGPLIVADIDDAGMLDDTLRRYRPFAAMHFAAYTYVGESVADPERYYRNNMRGSLELLSALRRHGVGKLVFSSTAATFGEPKKIPIDENHPQSPINPYGKSKLFIEAMIGDFVSAYGMSATVLRYFNAAGADPDSEIGEDHDPETHLIPLVLDAAMGRRESITIFGEDYDTPDGSCIRDYVHVSDLADAHLLALEKMSKGGSMSAYNLGCQKGYSVREVIDCAAEVTGLPIEVVSGERRAGDPARLVADSAKIKCELGWCPVRSDLKTIVSDAWAWHRKRFAK